MRFSVIMPSRLTPYPGCAQLLNKKIVRAVNSVLNQNFTDFELLIIADGCEETKKIVGKKFGDLRIKLFECEHKALFDNLPRNLGLDKAQGEYIIYCDIDDYWGPDHLKTVDAQLGDYDWVWYNDFTFNNGQWQERACNIRSMGGSGTSNICHKRSLGLRWGRPGYAHDFHFNQQLVRIKNGAKIETPQYFVLHIPSVYDL